jgi:hypothetical protein
MFQVSSADVSFKQRLLDLELNDADFLGGPVQRLDFLGWLENHAS